MFSNKSILLVLCIIGAMVLNGQAFPPHQRPEHSTGATTQSTQHLTSNPNIDLFSISSINDDSSNDDDLTTPTTPLDIHLPTIPSFTAVSEDLNNIIDNLKPTSMPTIIIDHPEQITMPTIIIDKPEQITMPTIKIDA
ncbi:unnamed protein product [Adineta steineri]|uniref:Uncharacterized protein n=1 Tax=Adineta steineri TaxID=433720 RepID=A0A814T495_9BILA|nr:unnamed protein product [Adineta steineri]CAF3503426.1 unnamed protein product [Adineta steineri]